MVAIVGKTVRRVMRSRYKQHLTPLPSNLMSHREATSQRLGRVRSNVT